MKQLVKHTTTAIVLLAALAAPLALRAADAPATTAATDAPAKKVAGPNGGRIMTETDPHFEFLVLPDRKVRITFLGADHKPAPLQGQTLTATGGDRAKPTKLVFAKDGESLVSDQPLPGGKVVPLVLQVKTAADAKAASIRLSVNLNDCPGCQRLEYACTCDSH